MNSIIIVEVLVIDINDNLLVFMKYVYIVVVLENVFGGF